MVFANSSLKNRRSLFKSRKEINVVKGKKISSFMGQVKTSNPFNIPLGQLYQNQNMEYLISGNNAYLKTKRGSTLIQDITNQSYGADIYTYDFTDEFHVWIDSDGDLKYCDIEGGTPTTIQAGFTTEIDNSFVMFGLGTYSVLYGANKTDGVFKISGATPTYGAVTGPNLKDICYSKSSGRMIGVNFHTVYWTEVQVANNNTTNIEDWGIGTNNAQVSEDSGSGFVACLESNEITCLFKDSGVWGLTNASEDSADWVFPALTTIGTQSKKTVALSYYGNQQQEGIVYLGTDRTLRFLVATITRNSGKIPTMAQKNSFIISKNFQSELDNIPEAYLNQCVGTYYNGYYFFNYVGANSITIDKTIVIDLLKVFPKDIDDPIPQPYWFFSKNTDYSDFVYRPINNELYGYNKNGFIVKLLTSNKFYEEFPTRVSVDSDYEDVDSIRQVAIEWDFYTAWFKFSDKELLLKSIYLNWSIEGNWAQNLSINNFAIGQLIPAYNNGTVRQVYPISSDNLAYWDVAVFDVANFASEDNNISQNIQFSARGHYFSFGFYNTELNKPATFYSIEPIFEVIRNDPYGFRE